MLAAIRTLKGRQARLGGSELSRAQFDVLIELLHSGDMPAGDLAHAAHLSPATISGMLDHLVTCGHLERARSARDRRVVVCRLTDSGRRRLEEHRARWNALWEQALSGVPVSDLHATGGVLRRLAAMFEDAAAI
ncbi:MAG: MarR family winged helix-turn-helix transcriptional regulator [Solirubrobacteraceae bacterium]